MLLSLSPFVGDTERIPTINGIPYFTLPILGLRSGGTVKINYAEKAAQKKTTKQTAIENFQKDRCGLKKGPMLSCLPMDTHDM